MHMKPSSFVTDIAEDLSRGRRGVFMRINVAIAVACLSVATAAAGANAEAAIRRPMNIPEQPLDAALQSLAKQRDLQMIYPYEVVGTLRTHGVTGEMTFEEALSALLSGTGLEYKYLDEKTVTIVPSGSNKDRQKIAPVSGMNHQDDTTLDADADSAATTRLVWKQLMLAQTSATSAAQDVEDSNTTERLEEVIVTAQRRQENLQDVPISISVLGGAQLDRTNVSVIDELKRVPGIAGLSVEGGTAATTLSVRGVTSTGSQFSGTSTVGYYLDSVPFGFVRQATVPDSNPYDLQRVEVLRGPQGTLYGVNAANGVVRVLTQDPKLNEFEAKFRVATSAVEDGDQGYRGDAALNIPLIPGRLAARAVIGYEDSPGWVDVPYGDDINDRQASNARLKLLAAPTDNLSVGLMVWHSESTADSTDQSFEDRTALDAAPGNSEVEYDVYALTVEYEFPHFTFSSSSSLMDFANDAAAPPKFLTGTSATSLLSHFSSEVFAQEFALHSTADGPWKWSLGGIYRDVNDLVAQNIVNVQTGVGTLANPNGLAYKDLAESYAVFGELTRSFHDGGFDITAGLRYFEDKNGVRQKINPNSVTAPLINTDAKFDAVSPRLVLSWHASESLTTYASYAEGFRSGFGQSPSALAIQPTLPAVHEDNLVNYEVGIKGNALGGMLHFEAAAYYIDWEDTQIGLRIPIPGTTTTLAALVNSEGANGPGAEAGVTFKPTNNFDIGVNGSWSGLGAAADTSTIAGTTTVLLIPEGDRLPTSPEWTANLFADYRFALGSFHASVSGGVSYVSEMTSYLSRTTPPSVVVDFSEEALIARADFAVTAPSGWTASLFVENLTDENVIVSPASVVGSIAGERQRNRPRTIGLQFEYKY